MPRPLALLGVLLVSVLSAHAPAQDSPPAPARITTRWARDVSPTAPWPEYPRPALVRDRWLNLNGPWTSTVTKVDDPDPDLTRVTTTILVPFPPESSLSGVGRVTQPDVVLWYARDVTLPADWSGDRVLLHFGAVDWSTDVYVNGKHVGDHTGGYDPFSFDITDALAPAGKPNRLVVRVTDPTDTGGQPRGKQWLTPHGIWYTPTSGIWQTVWLEPVSRNGYVASARFVPHIATSSIDATITVDGPLGTECFVEVRDGDKLLTRDRTAGGAPLRIQLPAARLWTPDTPFLYDVTIKVRQGAAQYDLVKTYFAFREITVAKDDQGVNRLMLNARPVFQYGPLDQGFWPDGLYTPPTDEAMRFDIEAVKAMGGNMLRKHVKVESQRFYWWCDRLGVMVWQDMPSPFFRDPDARPGEFDRSPALTPELKESFEREWTAIMAALNHHPSIVMWVPFNEGWGQNDLAWSRSVVERTKAADPTRLVNNASGWTDMQVGDVVDVHVYPGPGMAPVEPRRASVLGEFGGLGLPLEGHTWADRNSWGYVSYASPQELTDAYVQAVERLPVLIGQGLAAAVYTQTSDVEIEVNGWLTYDRAVWKIDPARAAAAAKALYAPPPLVRTLVPRAGEGEPASWRFTTTPPPAGWSEPGFDDSTWSLGKAGFGTPGTPGAIVGTPWTTGEIWIRRTFDLAAVPQRPHLSIHHDEDAEVYINGVLAGAFTRWTTGYQIVPMNDAGAQALRAGANTIAIRCRQTSGGQYIDCGIVEVRSANER